MHTDPREEWPLALAGPSAAAESSRAAFVAAVRSHAPALIVADRGLDAAAIARAIHERSRPGTPLIVIDCAAVGAQGAQDVDRQLFGTRPRTEAHADLDAVGSSSALLRARGGTLELSASLDDESLTLEVRDDGPGAASDVIESAGGVGLRAVRQRLETRYDGRAKFAVTTSPGEGFSARVTLPAHTSSELVATPALA